MTRYAVLLRGINVGASTKVAMPRLRELAEGLGWTHVSTYINSGNLFAECGDASRAAVEEALAGALRDDLGRDVDVVARTREQVQVVVDRNPFPDVGGTLLHAVFLTGPADPDGSRAAAELVADLPEEVVVDGDVVYVHYPDGQGRSKVDWDRMAWSMKVKGTSRNWRTVQALLDRV